jgi:hypothetical protein
MHLAPHSNTHEKPAVALLDLTWAAAAADEVNGSVKQ